MKGDKINKLGETERDIAVKQFQEWCYSEGHDRSDVRKMTTAWLKGVAWEPAPTERPINYERFPEGLNPYELSDLLAGIRQLTTDLAKERMKRELTFHEKQKLDLLLDNMNWKLPAPQAVVWTHEKVKHFAEWIGEAGYENYTTFDQWRKELDKEPFDKPHWPFSTEDLIKEYLNQKS